MNLYPSACRTPPFHERALAGSLYTFAAFILRAFILQAREQNLYNASERTNLLKTNPQCLQVLVTVMCFDAVIYSQV